MSLRWRILGSFITIILFTIVLSTGVAFWLNGRWLLDSTAKILSAALADNLSQAYAKTNNWDLLTETLWRQGYLIDDQKVQGKFKEWDARKKEYTLEEASDLLEKQPINVVVADMDGRILIDTYAKFAQRRDIAFITGEPSIIYNLATQQPVGTVVINTQGNLTIQGVHKFFADNLYPLAIGGLITAIIALLMAVWLSRRITAPITTLSQAARSIIQNGSTQPLPIHSADELGQMSATFNEMIAALQTQRGLRSRLLDDVSHELNTPLSVILLAAHSIRDGIKSPTEAATQIIHEAEMLRNLTNDLAWIAETDSGELQLDLEPCSLGQLLTTEVERWQLQAQAAAVTLALLPLPSDLPTLQLDRVRMTQVVGNLIQNSLQHTPASGYIRIHCQVKENLSEAAPLQYSQVAISDSGSGIPAADLPLVFERFYRVDAARQRDRGGRGLGLSIVKQIVEAHGGEVWAESTLGKGSCFTFRLPM